MVTMAERAHKSADAGGERRATQPSGVRQVMPGSVALLGYPMQQLQAFSGAARQHFGLCLKARLLLK